MRYSQLDIKRYLFVQTRSFRALGIEISAEELNWRALCRTCAIALATIVIIVAMGYYSWQHRNDLTLLTDALAPLVEFVLVFWKAGICLYKRRRIVTLVKRIHQLSLKARGTKEFQILVEENSRDLWLSGFYYAALIVAASIILILPLCISAINFARTGEFQLRMFFKGSYPFEDDIGAPYCLFVYVCNCCSVYFGGYVCVAIESLFSWLMHNIVAHFRMAQSRLEYLSEKSNESGLRNWIYYHQQNLSLAEEFNAIYSPVVFAQFALNSTQIGLVAYQITQIPALAEWLFLIVFLIAVVMQPTIYCYGGQRLEDESQLVALTVYKNVEWHHWSLKSRNLMRFPIMRAQRSCKLTGIFFVVNLNLYLWLLRTTASYMTLLWSIK